MRVRHPILLACWACVLAVAGKGLMEGALLGVALLVTPFLAIATLSVVVRRGEPELFRAGWGFPYRVVCGIMALASLAGIFSAAARIVTLGDGAQRLENGPLALLFLIGLFAAWPAVTRPTPRRAAVPAVVVHLAWVPLLVLNLMSSHRYVYESGWHRVVSAASLGTLLLFTAFSSILALVAFDRPEPVAEARQLQA